MTKKKMLQRLMAVVLAGAMLFAVGALDVRAEEVGNRDGVFIYGGAGWDGRFNSIMANNIYDAYVWTIVQEALITNNMAGEPIPDLATWEICDDGLVYTFSIDPRVTFSDGRPLTAYDVEFTYRTIADPEYDGPRTSAVQDLVGFEAFNAGETDEFPGIQVIDDHTIVFTHYFASPQHIWNFGFGVLCREFYAFETWDDFLAVIDHPFGSGQFVFVDYVFQQWIEFERNDNYWNPDVDINLSAIIMLQVPSASIVPATIGGEISMGQATSNLDNLNELEAAETASPVLFTANTLRHVTFNTTRPHLADHRVRQALVYAFDTMAYIVADTGSPDLRTVGVAPFSPVSWAFPDPATLNQYEFNMDRAAELMDEAGWTMNEATGYRYNADGERFALDWLIYHEAAWPGIITGLAFDSWGQLGAEVNVRMMDFAAVGAIVTDSPPGEKDFDIYQMGWSMAIDPDLTGGLWDYDVHVAGGFNASGWYNTRFQELIREGRSLMTIEERIPIYHEISAMANYYLPVWVLSNGTNLFALADNVRNLEVGAFLTWANAVLQQGTWIE